VVAHELGHVVGLDHSAGRGYHLMQDELGTGVRLLRLHDAHPTSVSHRYASTKSAHVFDEDLGALLELFDYRELKRFEQRTGLTVENAFSAGLERSKNDDEQSVVEGTEQDLLTVTIAAHSLTSSDEKAAGSGLTPDDTSRLDDKWTIDEGADNPVTVDWTVRFSGLKSLL
jgi:hypothetical protein